jgi:hypothetical protein
MSSYVLQGIHSLTVLQWNGLVLPKGGSPGRTSRFPLRLALELALPLADSWSSPDYRGTCKKNFLFLPRNQEHITESLKKKYLSYLSFLEFIVASWNTS